MQTKQRPPLPHVALADELATAGSRLRRRHRLAWTVSILWTIALLIRLTLKDRVPIVAALFYAAPPQILSAVAVLAAIVWSRLRRRDRAVASLAAACVCLIWSAATSFRAFAQEATPAGLRVVVWNTARGALGWDGVVEKLRSYDADLIGLVEAEEESEDYPERWKRAFPEYQVTDVRPDLVLMCKGPIAGAASGTLGPNGRYVVARIAVDRQPLAVYLVDVEGNPRRSRREPLERLAALVAQPHDEPVLVMGDFNTPVDSVHFQPLREHFANAFEDAGLGYAPTWPVPAPVLQIDHVWVDSRIRVTRCVAGWSAYSDHRPLVVDLTIDREASP